MMTYTNSDPTQAADPVIGILGSVPSGPQAGYPQITIPMGYVATTRRTQNVSVNGNAYDERNLIGIGYVIEQATKLRQPASMVNPSMYRCAKTIPAPPFASRGGCNPDYDTILTMLGGTTTILPFSLETESVQSLAGAPRRRHAHLRDARPGRTSRASPTRTPRARPSRPCATSTRRRSTRRRQLDKERAKKARARPAVRHPGAARRLDRRRRAWPTTGGSIALQNSMPSGRLDDRRQAEGGRARSSSARRTSPSSTACSTRTCPRATRRSAAR